MGIVLSLHLWVSMSHFCIDLQVREQQRYIALQIRQAVEQKRQHELEQLEKQLREDWERQQKEKLDTLQRLYQESLQLLGQGHRSAKENVRSWAKRRHCSSVLTSQSFSC